MNKQHKKLYMYMKSKGSKRVLIIIIALLIIAMIIKFMNWSIEDEGAWKPDYPKIDLAELVLKEYLTEEDYNTIFMQTGLGREAVDVLIKSKKSDELIQNIKKFQDDFFLSGDYECRVQALIVHDERIRDENGRLVKGFEILDVRNGDIFITKGTHSLGWRHGHAAIVIDKTKGETLEAIRIGENVILQSIDKWRTYPSFIQLRLKEYDSIKAEKIAVYAKKELHGLSYGLFTGIPNKKPDELKSTQCAHVVWYPYERFGYDLDSDGSWLVTPKDITNSEHLEIVQIYGVNPEEIWE